MSDLPTTCFFCQTTLNSSIFEKRAFCATCSDFNSKNNFCTFETVNRSDKKFIHLHFLDESKQFFQIFIDFYPKNATEIYTPKNKIILPIAIDLSQHSTDSLKTLIKNLLVFQ